MANMLKVLLGNVLMELAAVIAKRAYALRGEDVKDKLILVGLVGRRAAQGETSGTEHLN